MTASTLQPDRYIQYREFQTPRGQAHRPILDARFTSGPGSIELPMLVHSGADNVGLPSHALDFLNLNPAHYCEHPVRGAGGPPGLGYPRQLP